jgi:hypothetical protein
LAKVVEGRVRARAPHDLTNILLKISSVRAPEEEEEEEVK